MPDHTTICGLRWCLPKCSGQAFGPWTPLPPVSSVSGAMKVSLHRGRGGQAPTRPFLPPLVTAVPAGSAPPSSENAFASPFLCILFQVVAGLYLVGAGWGLQRKPLSVWDSDGQVCPPGHCGAGDSHTSRNLVETRRDSTAEGKRSSSPQTCLLGCEVS